MTTTTETKPEASLVFDKGRWRDANGKEYRLPIRTMWVEGRDLRVRAITCSTASGAIGDLIATIKGIAIIERRSGLSEMVAPDHGTRELSLTLRTADEGQAVAEGPGDLSLWLAGDETEGAYKAYLERALKRVPVTVSAGFIAHDWEIGTPDCWFLEIDLPGDTFAKLVEAVRQDRAHHLSLGLKFVNLYVTDYYVPLSDGVCWYLPPSPGSPRGSDMAMGYVASVSWYETPLAAEIPNDEARAEEPAETRPPETVTTEPRPPEIEPRPPSTAPRSDPTAATLLRIQSSLRWLVWITAAAVVALLVRH
jgi:hypothetical protein